MASLLRSAAAPFRATRRAARALLRGLLGRRPAVTEGRLSVEGAQRPVHIRRDRLGIPYIEAESEDDVWYGLGFCHGQDRCVQTDLLRRAATGTLAGILGRPALKADRFARRVGFRRVAEQQWAVLSAR